MVLSTGFRHERSVVLCHCMIQKHLLKCFINKDLSNLCNDELDTIPHLDKIPTQELVEVSAVEVSKLTSEDMNYN